MLSPKPLDKIQPNLVCELLTRMGHALQFFLAPWDPVEGSKGKISFNFNNKVNFIDFHTKHFVCVPTNERYKTYQTGFLFCPQGHALGVGLGGA